MRRTFNMRTTQDRVNLLLNHFGKERILENMLNEDLVFCKGAAYSSVHPHEMNVIATFGFNPKSRVDFKHSFFKPDHNKFKEAFHRIENDESKYLQIQLDDYYGFIHQKNERQNKLLFTDSLPVFEAIGTMAGGTMSRFFVKEFFEEFEGVVSHSYEVMIDVGEYGNSGFNTRSTNVATDDLFLQSVQYFIKKYCKEDITIGELKKDLIGSISKYSLHEDIFKFDFNPDD